jgi:coproporphyrinogen III oxidase-like Fe-S oxidoreductase
MDHFALPEDSLAVAKRQGRLHRNFQGYSTQADCDLIALGVSAIGRVGPTYGQNAKTLDEYRDRLEQGRLPVVRGLAVSRDDLAATGRHKRVVLARGVVVHLAREMTTLSFPEIARHLGRTAHSSAHAAARRVRDMLDRGDELPPDDRAADSRSVRELVETVRRGVERRSRATR